MSPRRRSALLWGAVGLLTYLVAVQAYLLAVGPLPLSPVGLGGLAVVVGAGVAVAAYALEPRLQAKGRT